MRSVENKETKAGLLGLMFPRPVTGVETYDFTEMRLAATVRKCKQ